MLTRPSLARTLALLAVASGAGCGRTSLGAASLGIDDTGSDDEAQTSGDPDDGPTDTDGDTAGDGGDTQGPEVLDWRLMTPAQWPLVQEALSAARAQGTSGPMSASTIALSFSTTGWAGAVLAPNGLIYGIPFDASHVIEIDPGTTPATVREIGPDLGTATNKWHGGVLDASGIIVGVPYSAFELLLIDVRVSPVTVRTLGVESVVDPAPGALWTSAVRAYDGRIHMIPGTATTVLAVDMTNPDQPSFHDYGDVSMIATSNGQRYGGGALEPTTGLIFAVPYGAGRVLEIDPVGETLTEVGDTFGTPSAWYGAVIGVDGVVYGMPSSAGEVLSASSTRVTVITAPSNGCDSGVTTAVGVFCLPYGSTAGFIFDELTGAFTPYSVASGTSELFSGGALAPNGHIYVVPVLQNEVLDIDTKAVAPLGANVLLGGFLNNY